MENLATELQSEFQNCPSPLSIPFSICERQVDSLGSGLEALQVSLSRDLLEPEGDSSEQVPEIRVNELHNICMLTRQMAAVDELYTTVENTLVFLREQMQHLQCRSSENNKLCKRETLRMLENRHGILLSTLTHFPTIKFLKWRLQMRKDKACHSYSSIALRADKN